MPDNHDERRGDEQYTDRVSPESGETAGAQGGAGTPASETAAEAPASEHGSDTVRLSGALDAGAGEAEQGAGDSTARTSASGRSAGGEDASGQDAAGGDEAASGASAADGTATSGGDVGEESTERNSPVEAFSWPGEQEAAPSAEPAESDAERTAQIAALPSDFPNLSETTQSIPAVPAGTAVHEPQPAAETGPAGGADGERRRGLLRGGIIAGAVVLVLGLLYIGDVVFSSGTVPRGTVVADVDIGGMQPAAAEKKLREQLGPELHGPVEVRAGDNVTTLDPDSSGLRMDWQSTVSKAGDQPLNPFTRVTSFFSDREVAPVSTGDRQQVAAALQRIKPQLDREAREGTVRFEGAEPVPVLPVSGRHVDVEQATDAVMSDWAKSGPVDVPFDENPVRTTAEGVQRTVREIKQGPLAGPVQVTGEGAQASLDRGAIAAALRFEPGANGSLDWHLDVPAAAEALEPQLAGTLRPPKNAEVVLEGGKPTVRPSKAGRGVDWEKSFANISEVFSRDQDRSVQAVYEEVPPEFTTKQARDLGIREVVGEFQTGGFEKASGVNIRRVAEQVNGAIIKPGETFSLNGHTGRRGKAQGYVESGVIEDGRPQKAVGGGISQFATTLFNASYFAGMQDVEHKEHSYYISRYPAGREATVFQGEDGTSIIDVKFKNVSDSGIMITTEWTPQSINVKLWGTKQFEVQSQTSDKRNITPPHEQVIPPGEPCSQSSGTPGFTVVNTRTIKDLKDGGTSKEREKTVYEPQPIIHCGAPPPPPPGR
ncbi:hypothetical protein GCM10027174_10620 [Salinifilum aidingensis]